MADIVIPKKLYKYRKFDVKALDMLTDHGLYYSNPKQFNDPLDCDLAIEPDLNPKELSDLLKALMGPDREDEWRQEVGAAIHYAKEIGNLKTDPDALSYLKSVIAADIATEVKHHFDERGVVCLSTTWKSVLMWSHYADEHKGVCFEFDTTELEHSNLAPVRYDTPRSVKASDIYAWMVTGEEGAAERAFNTHFYSKAPDWHYEQEWREVGKRETPCGDYRITGVYFGYRCPYAVKVAVVKMLGTDTKVGLYEVYPLYNSFELACRETDKGEIDALGMREPSGIEYAQLMKDFDDLDAVPE